MQPVYLLHPEFLLGDVQPGYLLCREHFPVFLERLCLYPCLGIESLYIVADAFISRITLADCLIKRTVCVSDGFLSLCLAVSECIVYGPEFLCLL